MKFSPSAVLAAAFLSAPFLVDAQGQMVKMCLFYDDPSGHARSDPIIDQQCASGHVHSFYGPQNFHPNTSYQDLRDTPPEFSTSPFVENQSLYWHPTIYEVTDNADGTKTYTRAPDIFSSPYYRWDNSVNPKTEAFPPEFRMIAHSNDFGADQGGESEGNMLTECCNFRGDGEVCESWDRLEFPTRKCDFLGIAFAMPTCWNGELGKDNDHKNHMAYTTNGEVSGPCPSGYDRRLPQVQLFVRVNNYKGGKYQLSDNSDVFHVDFMNGWQEGKLQQIIDGCAPFDQDVGDYNPPCGCTEAEDGFLTPTPQIAKPVCDVDVRELIIDEATDVTTSLPTGSCQGAPLIPKSWTSLSNDLLDCAATPGGPTAPVPTQPVAPVPSPTVAPVAAPTGDACVDQPLAFKNKSKWNCDWVAQKAGQRCKKMWKNKQLSEYCPVACDTGCDDAPVSSPTQAPVAPVSSPTQAPVAAPTGGSCVDQPLAFKNKAKQDCDWVAQKAEQRCSKEWKNKPLSEYCPVACDVDCNDAPVPSPVAAPVSDDESEDDGACVDQPLAFKNKSKFNCDWVGEKPHVRCDKEWKNKELWEYCPVACDEC